MLKLLFADDEVLERRYLRKLFEKHTDKFEIVGEAKDGLELIQVAMKTKPDILILDINMPHLDGLESACEIKSKNPNTVIILNTAYAEFEFARKALAYNLDAYLLKPASENDIMDTIDTCLKRRENQSFHKSGYKEEIVKNETSSSTEAVSIVKKYIDENSHLPLTLDMLSQLVHFSPAYFSRVFHQEEGVTIRSYVNKKRLENAEYMICNSSISIQEIAVHCGYASVSHFNRVFKQEKGCAPMEYRHLHKTEITATGEDDEFNQVK